MDNLFLMNILKTLFIYLDDICFHGRNILDQVLFLVIVINLKFSSALLQNSPDFVITILFVRNLYLIFMKKCFS